MIVNKPLVGARYRVSGLSPTNNLGIFFALFKKLRTRVDLLSIPQSEGKNVKYKTCSWYLIGFPYGSNIGSTV